MTKLTEIMRQKKYQPFAELLSRFKTGIQTDEHICCNQYRSISLLDSNYPSDALYIWAENIPVDQHNNARLAMIPKPIFTLPQINILTMSINKILTEYWQEEDLKLVDLIMNFI